MQRQDYIKVMIERIINPLALYDDIQYAYDDLYLVKNKTTNLYGLINHKCQEIISCNYGKHQFYEQIIYRQTEEDMNSLNLKVFTKDWLKGYIDSLSNIIIPCMYQKALPFSENLAAVKYNEHWGYIDESNNTMIPFEYDYAKSFKEGLAPVKKNHKWGYINKNNQLIIPYTFDLAFEFKHGYALVKHENEYFFIDKTGKIITTSIFQTLFIKNISDIPKDIINYQILEYLGILEIEDQTIIISENNLEKYKQLVLDTERHVLDILAGYEVKKVKIPNLKLIGK